MFDTMIIARTLHQRSSSLSLSSLSSLSSSSTLPAPSNNCEREGMDRKEHKQWGREEMVMKMREMGMLDQFNAVVDLMEAEVYGARVKHKGGVGDFQPTFLWQRKGWRERFMEVHLDSDGEGYDECEDESASEEEQESEFDDGRESGNSDSEQSGDESWNEYSDEEPEFFECDP